MDAPLALPGRLKQNMLDMRENTWENTRPTSPLAPQFGPHKIDESFLDILAAMSDDEIFLDDESLFPTARASAIISNDLRELDQAYSNLSISDVTDLHQFPDDNAIFENNDSFVLPPPNPFQGDLLSQKSRKRKSPNQWASQWAEQGSNDASQIALPSPDAIFEQQLSNSILCNDAKFQGFGDLLNSNFGFCLADNFQNPAPKSIDPSKVCLTTQALEFSQGNESHQQCNLSPRKKTKKVKKKKKKSCKRKSRKRKADTRTLAEKRRTKWRRGSNDLKMKRGIHQVRILRRKIRVVAIEEGMNERTLRRYVHISMDPRRKNSGYYMPVQPGEKVPKCLRSIVQEPSTRYATTTKIVRS